MAAPPSVENIMGSWRGYIGPGSVGIVLNGQEVAHVVPGYSAHQSGQVGAGDLILSVDGKQADVRNAAALLKGEVGTIAHCWISKFMTGQRVEVWLERKPPLEELLKMFDSLHAHAKRLEEQLSSVQNTPTSDPDAQNQLQRLEQEKRIIMRHNDRLQEEVRALGNSVEKYTQDIAKLQRQDEINGQEIAGLGQEIARLHEQAEVSRQDMAALGAERDGLRDVVAELRRQQEEQHRRISDLQNELESRNVARDLEVQLDNISDKLRNAMEENKSLRSGHDELLGHLQQSNQ